MGAHLCLLALSSKDTVIVVLCALIYKHLRHGNGSAREVGVVVETLPHLHQPYTHISKQEMTDCVCSASTCSMPYRVQQTVGCACMAHDSHMQVTEWEGSYGHGDAR